MFTVTEFLAWMSAFLALWDATETMMFAIGWNIWKDSHIRRDKQCFLVGVRCYAGMTCVRNSWRDIFLGGALQEQSF